MGAPGKQWRQCQQSTARREMGRNTLNSTEIDLSPFDAANNSITPVSLSTRIPVEHAGMAASTSLDAKDDQQPDDLELLVAAR
jgi:hypothetical protein